MHPHLDGLVCLWLYGLLWLGVVSVSGALGSWLVVVGLCVWVGVCFQAFSVSGCYSGLCVTLLCGGAWFLVIPGSLVLVILLLLAVHLVNW